MKPTTINVQITKCPKQYEAVRLGMEASLDEGETVESAIKAATAQLNTLYEEMYNGAVKVAQNGENEAKKEPQPVPEKKERLTLGDKRTQQIIVRIEKNPERAQEILDNTHKYFEPDADTEKALQLAVQLNNKLKK